MPLQVKQVAQFPTNHLLPRTLVDIANKKDTKKEIVFSFVRWNKPKQNPSTSINESALWKEEHIQYPA